MKCESLSIETILFVFSQLTNDFVLWGDFVVGTGEI